MKTSRFATEQIVAIPQEHAAVASAARPYPASRHLAPVVLPLEEALRRSASERSKRLKALEEENRRLKRLVADEALNLQIVKDVLGNGRRPP